MTEFGTMREFMTVNKKVNLIPALDSFASFESVKRILFMLKNFFFGMVFESGGEILPSEEFSTDMLSYMLRWFIALLLFSGFVLPVVP